MFFIKENRVPEVLLAFVTGLTAGGLSCLAVQGGLLASSLAGQIEREQGKAHLALPIVAFLLSKWVVHTLFGALLGWFGSFFQLSPWARAGLLLVIGVFMIGNGLRMLNVHPWFRFFTFEPPARLTRFIRRRSREQRWLTPVLLGALTLLIPCGVTQTMFAAAVASGNPWQGAALMGAFVLGASPVFFAVSYFAARLGARLERIFVRLVAIGLLVVGLISVENGLNLAGSPVSAARLVRAFEQPRQPGGAVPGRVPAAEALVPGGPALPTPTLPGGQGVIALRVLNTGYEPARLETPANQALTLHLVTDDIYSCTRAFVIPALNVEAMLPVSGEVLIDLPPQPAGRRLAYACSMGMYSGEIVFR